MATRFGAVSPAQTYKTKMLWAVGCLVTIVLILGFVIVMLWQTSENPDSAVAATPTDTPVNAAPSNNVDVLVAATRIEEGTRIESHMFLPQPMDVDKKPMAVVLASDLDSVIGKYARRVINPNIPLVMDDITDLRPLNSFRIPPGYRAVTILVDVRSGVEGFAKPNTRVDVLWSYVQDTKKKVATIVRFVKVLSVGGATQATQESASIAKGNTPVTLLVTEKDAKKIELARTLGDLSLSLVGDKEPGASSGEPDAITINDLIGRPATQEAVEEPNDGEMFTVDPRSGRQIRYVVRNGRWVRDAGFDEQ